MPKTWRASVRMRGRSNVNTQTDQKHPKVMPLVLVSGLVLVSATAVGGWMYFEGNRIIRAEARALDTQYGLSLKRESVVGLTDRMDWWNRRMLGFSIAAYVGLVGLMILTEVQWRRRLASAADESRQHERRCQDSMLQMQRVLGEKKRLEEVVRRNHDSVSSQVEGRTAGLTRAYAALEQELNERKQAERMLAIQSKELERSKGVLEMHVQARTQELQKLQRRYESILNSAGEGICGLDLQGRTTFVNPAAAKLTGWTVEEMIGTLADELFHPVSPDGPPVADAHQTEQIFYRRDGSSFLVEHVRTPIKENDRLVGEVVIFKDITERKRTQDTLAKKAAELARSNAELEQFAFVASHDLQEPLRKIQSFGDRLKSKLDAAKLTDGRDYLERMQNAAARMQTLINDLLTFSRVISASQPFVPVDLQAIVRGVLSDLEVRIEQSKAVVEVGPLPTIEADPMQMRQLFQNLIGNALKFQPPGNRPVVKVEAQPCGRTVGGGTEAEAVEELTELTVQDNGIGFDEKYLDKVFAVFQRLHGRNEYEGTGVGLAVCRRITDRHGGAITARSKFGEGATFIVQLPVRQAAQMETISSHKPELLAA